MPSWEFHVLAGEQRLHALRPWQLSKQHIGDDVFSLCLGGVFEYEWLDTLFFM